MTTRATITADQGNKALKVEYQQRNAEGEWLIIDNPHLDPRESESVSYAMYDNRRVVVTEIGEFLT